MIAVVIAEYVEASFVEDLHELLEVDGELLSFGLHSSLRFFGNRVVLRPLSLFFLFFRPHQEHTDKSWV